VGSLTTGTFDVNYRDVLDVLGLEVEYVGLDIQPGRNVDIVAEDPYKWPLEEEFDIVISGQTLEHCKYFWLVFAEMVRVTKPGGYICVIAPKIQKQHRHPVDCWRFLPDGMEVLAEYAGVKCIGTSADHVSFDKPILKVIDCVGIFQK
jgi:SAM-dependent methyltransferase